MEGWVGLGDSENSDTTAACDGTQRQQDACEQRRLFVKMQLINSHDRHCDIESRCAALDAVLSSLVDNAALSEKLRHGTLQQYAAELQAVHKRITLGKYIQFIAIAIIHCMFSLLAAAYMWHHVSSSRIC